MKTICFLFVFVAVTSAELHEWKSEQKNVFVADLNNFIDRVKPVLAKLVVENNLDPLRLPDIRESFMVPGLLGHQQVRLELRAGLLRRLSEFRRNNNVIATYKDKVLTINLPVRFDVISAIYSYYLSISRWKYYGGINVEARAIEISVDIEFDVQNYAITLKKFKLNNVNQIYVSLQGNNAIKWLAEPINRIIIPHFRGILIEEVEKNVAGEVQRYLDQISEILLP